MPSASANRIKETYIRNAIRGAATALLWQASDATEDGNGYPITDSGPPRYAVIVDDDFDYVDAVGRLIAKDVGTFVRANWDTLVSARVRASQAGHDIILTANGHGAGFWDRGLGEAGDKLSEACKGYSFEAEFALAGDRRVTGDYNADDLVWLMVENTVLVNETREAWGDDWEASDS